MPQKNSSLQMPQKNSRLQMPQKFQIFESDQTNDFEIGIYRFPA